MSSRVDLEGLDALHDAEVWTTSGHDVMTNDGFHVMTECDDGVRGVVELHNAYPALRDEIKRLRLELAAKKQHIRACHAAAHGTIGIAEDALREAARLEVEAKRTTEKTK